MFIFADYVSDLYFSRTFEFVGVISYLHNELRLLKLRVVAGI